MRFEGFRRKAIALLGFALLAALGWSTLEAGKVRLLVLVVLGGLAVRVMLTAARSAGGSGYDREADQPQ